jgi:triosephosphate isomerase
LKWDEPVNAEMLERELEIIQNGRKPFVGGNWKSNGDSMFVDLYTNTVLNKIQFKKSKMEVMVAPAMIHIEMCNDFLTNAI